MNDSEASLARRALKDGSREHKLLGAAFRAFARYGFRRTSMEDIARGAGLSRSALYLHFRNKEDVFRSLVEYHFLAARERVDEALGMRGRPGEVLAAALAALDGEEVEALLASPHGAELLDTKNSTSAEVAAAGEAEIAGQIARWLEEAETRGHASTAGIGSAREVAWMLLAARAGIKAAAGSVEEYLAARARLARLFGAALER